MLGRRLVHPLAGIALVAVGLMLGPADAFSATKKKRSTTAVPEVLVPGTKAPVVAKARPVRTKGPSVLFIIADGLNDWVGWMAGNPQARTPNMDRLAALGMSFTNAHCAYALSNPSRTALLTGMWPWTTGVSGAEQDWRRSIQIQGRPTLPEYFWQTGFQTAAAGKLFHAGCGGPEGRLEGWMGGRRGFEQDGIWDARFPQAGVQIPETAVRAGRNFNGLDLWQWDWGPIDATDDETDDGKVARWAEQFLQKSAKGNPFFLAVGFSRPAPPWYVPRSYYAGQPLTDIRLPDVKKNDLDDVPTVAKEFLKAPGSLHKKIVTANLWPSAVRAYLASMTFCDAMVGRVLDAVERSPVKDDTIIVFTSDRGASLGTKQRWLDGGLWEEATRVPLVIVAPQVSRPGAQCSQPVSLVDIYPTLCDLAGLPKPAHLNGESLLSLLRDPTLKRARPALTASGGADEASVAVRTERWRYIVHFDGSEELYDHSVDPHEWTNIARRPEQEATVQELFKAVPQIWTGACRKMREVKVDAAADGCVTYWLQPGDNFKPDESPDISKRGIDVEILCHYDPVVDADSTLLSQGGPQMGFAIHMVDGRPAFTVNYDGLRTTLKAKEALPPGRVLLRALLGLDGSLALSATGLTHEVRGYAPMEGGFPRKPAQGLQVAQASGVLPQGEYPDNTSFDGAVERIRFSLLPGSAVETRAARAVPAE